MQQRQLRLGDILDDYCPRERRITNHAVVAMVGADVKQTRCTTCDADHEYKHAKVPRQRRKSETPAALYSQVLADAPKRVAHDPSPGNNVNNVNNINNVDNGGSGANGDEYENPAESAAEAGGSGDAEASSVHATPGSNVSKSTDHEGDAPEDGDPETEPDLEDGPVHRPLIRATLPRPEGQPPPTRPAPDFTIRHPGGRPNRFRHRHPHGGQQFQGNRSNGNMGGGPPRGNAPRQGGGRPPIMSRLARRQGPGRKRSK